MMKSKEELRQELKKWYAELPEEENHRRSEILRRRILKEEEFRKANTIFCYVSMKKEPDTRRLMTDILTAGKRLLVPRCIGEEIMEAVEIRSTDELIPGKYGIPEPAGESQAADPGSIDLMIIPALAVNKKGYRIGKGKGYYDRFAVTTKAVRWVLSFREIEFAEEIFDAAGEKVFVEPDQETAEKYCPLISVNPLTAGAE